MDPIVFKFIIFQCCIWIPIALGMYVSGKTRVDVNNLSRRLITINLVSIESFIVLWTTWGIDLSLHHAVLPLAGTVTVLVGLGAGVILSIIVNFKNMQKHTFIISSSLANHGFTMGGFVCYLLLGEAGLALSFIFIAYFMPYVIMVIFSYARFVGAKTPFSFKQYVFTPQNMPLYAVCAAILLQYCNIDRPSFSVPLHLLLSISIIIYYFAMGIYFKFTNIKSFAAAHVLLACVKFCIVPVCVYAGLELFHLPPDIRTIILIQAFMPAAVYSVIASILFNLDKEMATSMFVVNTVVFSVAVLPLLIYLFY